MAIEARLVDERDTQWEADVQDYRVFIVHDTQGWDVYDIDNQTHSDVLAWAQEQVAQRPGARYALAIRITNDLGLGLLWLTPDPDDLPAAA
ncbi:hypothetical protein ACFWEJ_00650 [Promicromonospora sp. NPDC060204]|uniref:hypothetical protein n=1 Tax=Promicromonospora sp. NPDC060204 TaxID=3347071 RepID=UPI00365C75BD